MRIPRVWLRLAVRESLEYRPRSRTPAREWAAPAASIPGGAPVWLTSLTQSCWISRAKVGHRLIGTGGKSLHQGVTIGTKFFIKRPVTMCVQCSKLRQRLSRWDHCRGCARSCAGSSIAHSLRRLLEFHLLCDCAIHQPNGTNSGQSLVLDALGSVTELSAGLQPCYTARRLGTADSGLV